MDKYHMFESHGLKAKLYLELDLNSYSGLIVDCFNC